MTSLPMKYSSVIKILKFGDKFYFTKKKKFHR